MERQCSNCQSTETRINKPRNQKPYHLWHNDKKGGWFCSKCYTRLVTNPKWNPKWNPINNPKHNGQYRYAYKRIRFKTRDIYLRADPKTHFCIRCGRFGYTDMHHEQYHDDDPLKDTVELCKSCHAKESWRIRKLAQVIKTF